MRKSFFTGFLTLLFFTASAQELFQKTWGNTQLDVANDIEPTLDNNFIITGSTYNSKLNCGSVLLMKINSSGDTLWTRVYGNSGGQTGYNVIQTADSGYLISATGGGAIGNSSNDIILIKTDEIGNVQWSKVYGGQYIDNSVQTVEVPGNGYLLVGETESFGYRDTNFCGAPGNAYCPSILLIRTNENGDTLFTRVIYDKVGKLKQISSIRRLKDDNFLLSGFSNTSSILLKIDSSGNLLWSKVYQNKLTSGKGIIEKPDGNLIIMGNGYWGNIIYTQGIFIMETDSAGKIKWIKITDNGNDTTSGRENGFTIKKTGKNGYLISLHTDNYGDSVGTGSLWGGGGLIKFDSLFNIEWQKTYGGGGDWIYNNTVIKEYYVNVGKMQSFDKGNSDIYIVSTDSTGNAGCLTWDMNLTMLTIAPATIQIIDTGFVAGNTNTIVIDYPLQQGYPELYMMDCDSFVGIAPPSPQMGGEIAVYPNPVSDEFTVMVYLPATEKITIELYDIMGRSVKRLYEGEAATPPFSGAGGAWMSQNFNATGLNNGIYFMQVRGETNVEVIKVVVVK